MIHLSYPTKGSRHINIQCTVPKIYLYRQKNMGMYNVYAIPIGNAINEMSWGLTMPLVHKDLHSLARRKNHVTTKNHLLPMAHKHNISLSSHFPVHGLITTLKWVIYGLWNACIFWKSRFISIKSSIIELIISKMHGNSKQSNSHAKLNAKTFWNEGKL